MTQKATQKSVRFHNDETGFPFLFKLQGGVKTLLKIFTWHDFFMLRDYLAF